MSHWWASHATFPYMFDPEIFSIKLYDKVLICKVFFKLNECCFEITCLASDLHPTFLTVFQAGHGHLNQSSKVNHPFYVHINIWSLVLVQLDKTLSLTSVGK